MLKKMLLVTLVAGALSPIAHIAAPAAANPCTASPILMYFYHGVRVDAIDDEVVAQQVNFPVGSVGCILTEDDGSVDIFIVPPGSTFVAARDDGSLCVDVAGTVSGLGLHHNSVWKPSRSIVDDSCNVEIGTPGAQTELLPIDPTQLGTISASTVNSPGTTYRTVDGI